MQKMKYTKTFVAEDGEEFPYSEKIDEGGYAYWISVVIDSRNAELFICNWGAHIEFDDDRSWLDFSIAPELMFPGRNRLASRPAAPRTNSGVTFSARIRYTV